MFIPAFTADITGMPASSFDACRRQSSFESYGARIDSSVILHLLHLSVYYVAVATYDL